LFCFSFLFFVFFSLSLPAYDYFHPCHSNASVDPYWRVSFHSLNSWHESMFEILTSQERGNVSPAMNTTLSGSETE
jgi:hypothetical protein